jgi:DNA-directed RNA polymerase subunit RPC12/RpoP
MTIHGLELFDNALDSLAEALSKFEEGDEGDYKSYKFAVLHMAHFIELIFKYHIASKHPLLIYKDPFAKKLDKNKTITLWEAVNFINNEAPDTVSSGFHSDLEWLKRLRNDIEHYKFTMDVPQVRRTIGRLFRSVLEFLSNYTELEVDAHIPSHTMKTFMVLSDEYEFTLRDAIREADKVESENYPDYSTDTDADPVRLDCPECNHPTLVFNDDSKTGFRCTFCGNEESEDLPSTCDICGTHTTQGELDYWEDEMGQLEGRCYYCSGKYHADKDD